MTTIEDETATDTVMALEVARGLVRHGIPVFHAKPAADGGTGGCGYTLPDAWQRTRPDESMVDAWRPGDALCMVTGCGLDGLDTDPRHGGDVSRQQLVDAGVWPSVLGVASTPSGGTHELVNPLGLGSRDGMCPGLDFKGGKADGTGRGFLFIAPTERVSKVTGAMVAYTWSVPPTFAEMDDTDDSGEPIAEQIRVLRAPSESPGYLEDVPHATYDQMRAEQRRRVDAYVDRLVKSETDMFADIATWPEGKYDDRGRGWEKCTADIANRLGRIARADWNGLTYAQAREHLDAIVNSTVADAVDVENKWRQQRDRREPALYPAGLRLDDGLDDWLDEASSNGAGASADASNDEAEAEAEAEAEFWAARPELAHIRTFALARMCSPWAVLAIVLQRVLATVPPWVMLPQLIGGPGSLNTFVALVGSSGVGKSSADPAARDAVNVGTDVYTAPVGSGEGLAHQYAHRERGTLIRDRDAVLFHVAEVDTMTALSSRQGSTLLGQLRSAFSGEGLGFGYVDPTKRLPIEAHTYRLGLTLGVQPERAASLLDDADGGTPQRFIWAFATDPAITADPPAEPEPWKLEPQRWRPGVDGRLILAIPEAASRMIRESHAARAAGSGEALDGHALFCREKVAAALTLLAGRRVITSDDWELAAAVMAASDRTRRHVVTVLERQRAKENHDRARAEAQRAIVVDDTVTDAAMQRVARRVLAHLQTDGETSWTEERNRLPSRDRQYFEDAVERLVAAGQVEQINSAHGVRLRAMEVAT